MFNLNNVMITKEPRVVKTWLGGGNSKYRSQSVMLTIPLGFAKDYDLDKPANVLVIPTENGLLLRKLVIAKD
jgi:hypothetical protein